MLVLAAAALWVASRMTWVEVTSFDGLGQPRTAALSGGSWSTALVPLAVLLLAAAVAALAVRGWPLRLLAVLVAVTQRRDGLPGDQPVGDPRCRRAGVASGRRTGGRPGRHSAALRGCGDHVVAAAVVTLACAVAADAVGDQGAVGRGPLRTSHSCASRRTGRAMSERKLWDALDEADPTQTRPIRTTRGGERRWCGGGYPS